MAEAVAPLDSKLSMLAKSIRVLRETGLPEDFFQRVIDDKSFREQVVRACTGKRLESVIKEALEEYGRFEQCLQSLGLNTDQTEQKDSFGDNGANRSRSLKRGCLELKWYMEIHVTRDGYTTSCWNIMIRHVDDRIWWSMYDDGRTIDLDAGDGMPLDNGVWTSPDHPEETNLTDEEIWVRNHFLLGSRDLRRTTAGSGSASMTKHEGQHRQMLHEMIRMFTTGEFSTKYQGNSETCPNCGSNGAFLTRASFTENTGDTPYPAKWRDGRTNTYAASIFTCSENCRGETFRYTFDENRIAHVVHP